MSFSKSSNCTRPKGSCKFGSLKTHSYKLIPNWTRNRMITYTDFFKNLSPGTCSFLVTKWRHQGNVRSGEMILCKLCTLLGWKLNSDSTRHWVSACNKCNKKSRICTHPSSFDARLGESGSANFQPCTLTRWRWLKRAQSPWMVGM